MTHAELAAHIAEKFLPEKDRAEYAAGLTRALDDRRVNRCSCNVGGEIADKRKACP